MTHAEALTIIREHITSGPILDDIEHASESDLIDLADILMSTQRSGEGHAFGCICHDCSGATITTDND